MKETLGVRVVAVVTYTRPTHQFDSTLDRLNDEPMKHGGQHNTIMEFVAGQRTSNSSHSGFDMYTERCGSCPVLESDE